MYIYLYLNIFTFFFPFILSFDKRVRFVQYWRFLFPAIAVNALIFITWDSWFTSIGVWSFNPDYLVGFYAFGLPLEELLFFLTVPYACVFIYETLNAYIQKDYLKQYGKAVSLFLVIFLVFLGLLFLPKLYTSITAIFLAVILVLHLIALRDKVLGRFYVAYLVHLIPFLFVNGILTAIPVVIYNNNYNLGIRLYTIPIEDTMYSMLMLLITITVYEKLKQRKQNKFLVV